MSEDKTKYWGRHIAAWQRSGLSQESYCRNNKIAKSAFGYWQRKLNKKNNNSLVQVQVQVPVTIAVADSLEVWVGSNIKIKVQQGFNPQLLKAIVEALEVRS